MQTSGKRVENIVIQTKRSTNYLYTNNKSSAVPTVFLHGFTGTAQSWEEIIEKLDYRAIAPDIVGHGKSTFSDIKDDYDIDDWCEDFSEILDTLKIDKLNICGYSMGGRLAIAYTAKNPGRVKTLFLESLGTSFFIFYFPSSTAIK